MGLPLKFLSKVKLGYLIVYFSLKFLKRYSECTFLHNFRLLCINQSYEKQGFGNIHSYKTPKLPYKITPVPKLRFSVNIIHSQNAKNLLLQANLCIKCYIYQSKHLDLELFIILRLYLIHDRAHFRKMHPPYCQNQDPHLAILRQGIMIFLQLFLCCFLSKIRRLFLLNYRLFLCLSSRYIECLQERKCLCIIYCMQWDGLLLVNGMLLLIL